VNEKTLPIMNQDKRCKGYIENGNANSLGNPEFEEGI
jgi:hypothetical protein